MQAFIAGKTNKDIVRVLEQYTDYGRHAANRLIRTETSYMVNKTDLEDSKNRGIKAKKFEANLDSRTSKMCRENNQKIIPIDKIKVGENAPPLHPYCRSFLSDVLKGWDYDSDDELGKLIKNSEIENRKSQEKYSDEVTKGTIKSKGTPNPDIEQYNRYKNTINADNFNLSFDEFVKIKYNNIEKYDELKLDYKTIKTINRNSKITNKNKAYDLYFNFKNENLVASDHFIEQFINREFDKKGNRKYDFGIIVELSKNKPNYIDSRNGRLIIYRNKISIIKENNRLITIRYGNGSKHWKEI